jgi:hypothetical protein
MIVNWYELRRLSVGDFVIEEEQAYRLYRDRRFVEGSTFWVLYFRRTSLLRSLEIVLSHIGKTGLCCMMIRLCFRMGEAIK